MPETDARHAIVCGITADHDFALGALLAGLMRTNPDLRADVIVIHDGLSDRQQTALSGLAPSVRFRSYTRATVEGRFVTLMGREAHFDRYSPLMFAKFEMLDLLSDYDRCLWLDADMLVRGDLSDLWSFDALTWRPLAEGALARRVDVFKALGDLPRDPAISLPNGGVIGVARAVRDRWGCTSADLYALAERLIAATDATSVDELAFHLLAATRAIPVRDLALRFNHPVTAPDGAGAVILHAIGPDKFWNATPLTTTWPDWAEHQRSWIAAGGAAYAGPQRLSDVHPMEPEKLLHAARMRQFWQDLWPSLRHDLPPGLIPDLRTDRKYLRLFLAGRDDSDHLRIVRRPLDRRIGVELHLSDKTALDRAAQALVDLNLGRGTQRLSVTVPTHRLGQTLATFAAAARA